MQFSFSPIQVLDIAIVSCLTYAVINILKFAVTMFIRWLIK